jgi:hypothetical protein
MMQRRLPSGGIDRKITAQEAVEPSEQPVACADGAIIKTAEREGEF